MDFDAVRDTSSASIILPHSINTDTNRLEDPTDDYVKSFAQGHLGSGKTTD
jgi:hypothetical protein